jgi:hypothetical protein
MLESEDLNTEITANWTVAASLDRCSVQLTDCQVTGANRNLILCSIFQPSSAAIIKSLAADVNAGIRSDKTAQT